MSNPFSSTGGVNISNIQLVNLPPGCSTYSVKISHNEKVKRKLERKKVDGNRIVWTESLLFPGDLTDQSPFHFKIAKTNIFGLKKTVGSWKEGVTNLLQLQKYSGSCKFATSEGYQLKFTIKQQDDILSQLVNEADNIPAGTSTSERLVGISNTIVKAHDTFVDQEDTWSPFLSQFGVFMNAIDTISEVHPYVKLAWGVLSVIPKTIISQSNRNDSINKLVQRLKEVYSYITDANRLPTLKETQSKALSVLVQQTIECAYFVKEYGGSHTAKKILTGGGIDGKINDFNDKFDHILNVMTNSVGLETSIVTLRISNDISGLRKDVGETTSEKRCKPLSPNKLGLEDLTLLGELPYAPDAGFSSGKCCLPGTRDNLITELLDWVNGNGSQQVLLLLGQAGRGKSAVAHTISEIFNRQNRLGAFFCFNRSYKDRRNLLFSTIARQLADGDIQWRESLARMITKTTNRISSDIKTQFNELIIEPSTKVHTIGPVVIVIDGLDESGDRMERGERGGLLETLQRCSELPSNYRFVITSRPELDIEEWSKHPTFFCKRMDDIDLDETTKDIQCYISSRFFPVKNTLDKELGDGWSLLLAKRAEGLFQWARTVCNFIDPTVKFGVAKGVKRFISGPTPSLYELYRQIFDDQSEFRNNDFLPEFKTIMGALIIIRKPPSMQALQSLFPEHDVKAIMQPFHSLFLGVYDPHTPIRPLHTSLPDFLTTRFIDIIGDKHDIKTKVENQFYIDTSDQGYFTLACLKLMNNSLRFNICRLETSHKPNQDVSDLDDRIQAEIPSHLSYACYFWAKHLEHSENQSKFSKNLLEQLHLLMRTNILYLFEILGLLQEVEQVCISMNILAEWCKGVDSELVKQAEDTCQFGYDSKDVIMKSTPHLYISALPFAQQDSFIRKQYLDSFPHHFRIDSQSLGSLRNSNVVKRSIPWRSSALAFSPQGRYIATGFVGGELWLWDYRTGEIIRKWEKHKSYVTSIVFSPNGESVTACFWDACAQTWNIDRNEHVSTEDVSISDYTGHSTVSNNGNYFVIDDWEKKQTLLYDITTRSEPKQLACFSRPDHGTISIFSSNGDLLAFQLGRDDMISLWHSPTQKVIGALELSETVHSMAFFPDGSRIGIVFDNHVEIWDVLTKMKTKIYEDSSGSCSSFSDLVIFPDGQHLTFLFGSRVYILNVFTGDLVHTFTPESDFPVVAISPDCKHIASDISNNTIQVQEWENASITADVHDNFSHINAQLSPGGRYLILRSWKANQDYLQILDTSTMNTLTDRIQLGGFITEVSPDDQYIAYIATNGFCLWSIMRGEVVLGASDCDFTALTFSSNSGFLISGDRSGNVIIWNTHTCQPSKIMSSEAYITALAFSATGAQFLVTYLSNSETESMIETHDSQSGKLSKGPFICHLSRPMKDDDRGRHLVAFSANESRIVLIFLEIFVLDAETGQILNTFGVDRYYEPLKLLSPNRKYLLTVTEDAKNIWDIDGGVEIKGQWLASEPHTTAFSNNPEEVFTVHITGINFWNIGTGNKTMTLMFQFERDGVFHVPNVSSNKEHLVLYTMGFTKIWSLGRKRECQAMSSVCENKAEVECSNRLEEGILSQTLSMADERKIKEYALMAWQKALFSKSSEMDNDGWMLGPNGELLFWIPKERRNGLWIPNMVFAVGNRPITRLDFDNFVHGSRWTDCKDPLIS